MTNPLRAYLAANDIKAVDFADLLGVSPSFLSRLMAGEREADALLLAEIERTTFGKVTASQWVKWRREAASESAA